MTASGQRNGALANLVRAEGKIMALADHLEANSQIVGLTWSERVIALNAAGVLNHKSTAREEYVPWTVGRLRKPWRAAMTELTFRRNMEAEGACVGF
jgi:hypothetical protein